MAWLVRVFAACAGLAAGAGIGFLFGASLHGEPIARPLAHPYQPLEPGTTWTYEVHERAADGSLHESVETQRIGGVLLDGERVIADVERAAGERRVVLTREGLASADGVGGLELPFQVRPGTRWEGREEGVVTAIEAVGVERLELPAGIFEVLHVRQRVARAEGEEVDERYYARDVGLVAETRTAAGGGRVERVLRAFEPGGRWP